MTAPVRPSWLWLKMNVFYILLLSPLWTHDTKISLHGCCIIDIVNVVMINDYKSRGIVTVRWTKDWRAAHFNCSAWISIYFRIHSDDVLTYVLRFCITIPIDVCCSEFECFSTHDIIGGAHLCFVYWNYLRSAYGWRIYCSAYVRKIRSHHTIIPNQTVCPTGMPDSLLNPQLWKSNRGLCFMSYRGTFHNRVVLLLFIRRSVRLFGGPYHILLFETDTKEQ